MRGAISADGDRVFFEAGNHLYLRDLAHEATLQLDQLQPGGVGGPDQPVFQAASRDGDRVFFTDTARLTAGSTAQPNQPDLYMCEITVEAGQPACALSDLSLDSNPGEAANVQGVSAIAADGSHVYFAANGALTSEANEHGEQAVPGGPQPLRLRRRRPQAQSDRGARGRGRPRLERQRPLTTHRPQLARRALPRLHVAAPPHRL